MKKIALIALALCLTSPAHASELFPSEQKRIDNLEAHMVAVQAQADEHVANIQAQIDLITAIADRRWDAYLAKCTVALLGIGCPSKPIEAWAASPETWCTKIDDPVPVPCPPKPTGPRP